MYGAEQRVGNFENRIRYFIVDVKASLIGCFKSRQFTPYFTDYLLCFALIGARQMPFSGRSEEHTSELQSLMRISYAVFCLKKTKKTTEIRTTHIQSI